ncbi:galactosyldiacylglycerol synthase [Streptomyces sp. NPDC127084]|uniref:MGDG synthase family glycosyltransferase n=1 Tax=Streptomyces sp. NPDC127084 TaxID=3347133 RepID=UPI003665050B
MARRRFLVLSASMGAGHDTVAAELSRRLRARGDDVLVRDVLTLLPPGAGPALRRTYRVMVRRAQWLYAGVYALFLSPGHGGTAPSSTPLARTAERALLALAGRWHPDAVVSTFHLAGQVTGRLRERGALSVPAAVFITDFAAHRGWLHPGNDLHICVTDEVAAAVRDATGRLAVVSGPVVAPEFRAAARSVSSASGWASVFARYGAGRPAVMVSAGAWGAGSALTGTVRSLADHGVLPVLLCGRDGALLRRASGFHGALALGWVPDMAPLMVSARVLVDNAAGQTAVQALAAGVPVVGYRPIPGHGAEGVRRMAAAGLSVRARDAAGLVAAVGRLAGDGPDRDRLVARGATVFRADAADLLTETLFDGRGRLWKSSPEADARRRGTPEV